MVKNSKAPKSKMTDTERGTLLEDIGRDVTRIAEAQSPANTQIADIKSTIAGLATKLELETVSMAVMQISKDVKEIKNKINQDLSNHDKRITKLEEKVLV